MNFSSFPRSRKEVCEHFDQSNFSEIVKAEKANGLSSVLHNNVESDAYHMPWMFAIMVARFHFETSSIGTS